MKLEESLLVGKWMKSDPEMSNIHHHHSPSPSSVPWQKRLKSRSKPDSLHSLRQDVWHGHGCPFYCVVDAAPQQPAKFRHHRCHCSDSDADLCALQVPSLDKLAP